MRCLLVMLVLAACQASAPAPAPELVVVAHEDDDMLFMQRDLYEIVHARHPIVVVYVTAGDAGKGIGYVNARYDGVRFAYGAVAGSQHWTCAPIALADHTMLQCQLDDRPVTLLFMGYPDGGVRGEMPQSLIRLWQGDIERAVTIADAPATYNRDELIATVAAIIDRTKPQTIRTLEISGTHGDDHSDHMMVGTLTQLAAAQTSTTADLISYRGYNITAEPANLTDEEFAQSSLFMRAYGSCVLGCGVCGKTPCDTIDDPWYNAFLHRSYPVGMQDEMAGVLTSPVGCVGFASTDDATLVSCSRAPDLALDDTGLVRVDDQCLEVEDDTTLGLGPCDPDPTRYFQLDDEGHLWSGVVADGDAMLFDHTTCVYVANSRVQVGTCGADRDFRWTLRP